MPAAGTPPAVFINCPFDADFRAQMNAIVFACVHAGFYPVVAGSSGRTGQPRLERILSGAAPSEGVGHAVGEVLESPAKWWF